jgi:hypothetical protein
MEEWTVVDAGTPSPPSAWGAQDGVLVQTAETHGGSLDPASLDKPGTCVIAGDASWTDYRLTVRLCSHTEYGIGVLFRYGDSNNYYRFSMDRRLGYRRLIKKVNGHVEVLWEDHGAYEVGRDYLVTIDAFGDRVRLYVDGVRLCDRVESALSRGRVGLYCWGNAGAHFEEVAVLAPQFVDYYRFGLESRLPAGTVVHILPNAAHYDPGTETGIEYRSIAAFGEQGWPLLNPTGDVLRVVDEVGQEGHRRPFLPPSAYTAVPVSLLWTRDGTAAYLFFPDNGNAVGPVPGGHYRLALTFHRDLREKDPTSKAPVLRRAGRSTAEQVTIEFTVPPVSRGVIG